MTTVVTSCSRRKRLKPDEALSAADLDCAALDVLARDWLSRVVCADRRIEARSLYAGRQFGEARQAAEELKADLWVVSAGLGVIDSTSMVAPYALTVSQGADDSILTRAVGAASAQAWWQALTHGEVACKSLGNALSNKVSATGLILVSLSGTYLEMVSEELLALPQQVLERVRIFTMLSSKASRGRLGEFIMPYDRRLDGPDSPIPGTIVDFAGRALRHFAGVVFPVTPEATAVEHAAEVLRRLEGWRVASPVDRVKMTDEELIAIVKCHWTEAGASASQMLRMVRYELGIACSQERMHSLHAFVCAEIEARQ